MTASEDVRLTALEVDEVNHGLKQLKGTLRRAAQIAGPLELETAKREQLAACYDELQARLVVPGTDGDNVPGPLLYAARVATRLRFGSLKKLQATETEKGVAANHDVTARLERLEALGRKLGVQLELVAAEEEKEEAGDGEE